MTAVIGEDQAEGPPTTTTSIHSTMRSANLAAHKAKKKEADSGLYGNVENSEDEDGRYRASSTVPYEALLEGYGSSEFSVERVRLYAPDSVAGKTDSAGEEEQKEKEPSQDADKSDGRPARSSSEPEIVGSSSKKPRTK